MPYSRYVEVGRICVVNYGPDAGSLCTIVEVVDQNKCLVDGPRKITGVGRGIVPFKRVKFARKATQLMSTKLVAPNPNPNPDPQP